MPTTKLGFGVLGEDLAAPLAFEDIRNVTLTVDYAASDAALSEVKLNRGFFFKGITAGTYRAITLYQFNKQLKATNTVYGVRISDVQRNTILQEIVAAGNYVDLYLAAYQWSDSPVVFLERTGAASTSINIGLY